MKDDKKIKTEKIVLNGLVIAGIVLTLLTVLASPFIIVAIIKAGEFSALPPYTWILTTASVYVCAVPYLAALIELKLICSRIFTDKAFSMGTAKKFRNIGICAFAELLIFSVDQAVLCSMLAVYELMGLYYLPVFVFVFVCIVAGVLAFAMSGVCKRAADIKEENEGIFYRGDGMIVINLDVMMAKRKMSLTELADRLGMTMANVSNFKNHKAKAFRFSTLDALCEILDCQPGDLLEYVPGESEKE